MYKKQRQNRWSDSKQLQVYLEEKEDGKRESERGRVRKVYRINIRR